MSRRRSGNVLVPVVLLLSVVGAVSFLVSLEGALATQGTARSLEAHQARLVAEAGYSEAKWLLGQTTTCAGYSGIAPVAFGRHQYEVTVAPTDGSPVIVRTTASLATGAARAFDRTVSVYQAPVQFDLVPGAAGKDTYLWDGAHKDTNFGASPELSLDNKGKERTALLRFDLSGIPRGRVESAYLELYLEGGSDLVDGTIDLHRITQYWDEGNEDDAEPGAIRGATYEEYSAGSSGTNPWATPGGDFESPAASSITIADLTPGFYQWDATELVTMWLSGVENHGMLLRGSAGDVNKIDFASGDSSNSARHPKLVLSFSCECGVVCDIPMPLDDTLVLTTASAADLGGLSFEQEDAIEYSRGGATASFVHDGSGASLDTRIDALHLLEDGQLLLSTRDDASIGALAFQDDDIVRYDPATDSAVLILDGSSVFSADEDIVALSLTSTGTLVLSTEGDAQIGALGFTDLDLVEFDRTTGQATLFFEGASTSLDRSIDGVHVVDSQQIFLSVDNDASLGGMDMAAGDVVAYDIAEDSAVAFFDGGLFDAAEDVVSLHVGAGSGSIEPVALQPIAHWKLDDGSGSEALDSVGGHTGALEYGPTWIDDGQHGGALHFDGVDDRVVVPHDDALSFSEAFTIASWVRMETTSGTHRILSKEPNGSNSGYWLAVSSGALYVGIGGEIFGTSTSVVSSGAWVHVAATFDEEAEEVRLYVDGVEVLDEEAEDAPSPNSAPLSLGANWEFDKYLDGALDDVRLYDQALDPDEIADLASTAGGSGSSECYAADDFESGGYSGSTGTAVWSGAWIEVNESDGPSSGDERVTTQSGTQALQVKDNDGGGEGAERSIDLEGYSDASLSFRYWRDKLDNSSDYVAIEISNDGGSNWTELDRFAGPDDDSGWVDTSYDITDQMAAETVVRFVSSPDLGGGDRVYFDDVRVSLSGGSCE